MTDYSEALKNAARSMVRFKKPNNLLRMIVRFISREARLTHASVLAYNPSKRSYSFIDSKGTKKIPTQLIRVDFDHPLILWFANKKSLANQRINYLDNFIIQKLLESSSELEKEELENISDLMKTLNAAICMPCYFRDELMGVFILGKKKIGENFSKDEFSFFEVLADDAAMAIKNEEIQMQLLQRNHQLEENLEEIKRLRKKEQDTYYQIVLSLVQEVRMKDASTYGHSEAVEKLGVMTVEEMGLNLTRRKLDIFKAALTLHDVGKIGIPDSILKKEDSLDREEYAIMKQHVEKGVEILKPLAEFKEVANIIYCHHEYYDGSGYPRGLKGDEIPIESAIISVVDAFHAMVSSRCYKKGFPLDFAIKELEMNSGKQFHPEVVKAFLLAFRKNMKTYYESRIQSDRKAG